MSGRPLQALVLYWTPSGRREDVRAAIRHHLSFLESSPLHHRVTYCHINHDIPEWYRKLAWDVVILHTTMLCMRWHPELPALKTKFCWLRRLRCPVVAMPQDEYDHAHTLDDWLQDAGVSLICTNFDSRHRALLYPRMHMRARFLECFTGYVEEKMAEEMAPRLAPAAARPLDIVYRAARLPYWFGSQGQLKHRIAEVVNDRAAAHGLRCDISTDDAATIHSDQWFDFLASGRAIIGCESGSSVLDRRGEVRAQIRALLAREPGLTFAEVSDRMPAGWDGHRFFALGPRHFEAVITRTCQILVEGEFQGILQPNRHYLPLRRDFSNLDDVLEQLKDAALVDRITRQAYEEIYLSRKYGYRTLAQAVEAALPRRRWYATRFFRRPARVFLWLDRWERAQEQASAAWESIKAISEATTQVIGRTIRRPGRAGYMAACKALRAIRKHAYCLGLVLGRRTYRRVWRSGLLTPALWKQGGNGPLFKDLAKLAILGEQLRPAPGASLGRVLPKVELAERKLVFVSLPSELAEAGLPGPQTLPFCVAAQAIRDGLIADVWWDHSRVGPCLHYPPRKPRQVELYLGGNGIHHFRGLQALARSNPARVRALLLDVLNVKPDEAA
jgi:hypothetical protein